MHKLPESVVLNIPKYKILSPEGEVDFLGVNKIVKSSYISLKFSNGEELKCSEDHPIMTIDGIIRAKHLNKKNEVLTKDGGCFVISKRLVKRKLNLYDIINSGTQHLYFSNGIVSHNCEFLGSSNTLIDGKKLQKLAYRTPIYSSAGVDVYENPNKDSRYLIAVDTSRGVDIDYSAFVVFDITQMPYKIAAKFRKADIPPLLYPDVILQLAIHYNRALVLVETNDIGQQVVDILHQDLEYEGVLTTAPKGRAGLKLSGGFGRVKPQLGVRTTKQVKRIGCGNLKTLIESDRLLINDYDLIYELARFVEVKASYEAEEGHHDDLVMCCVLFAWLVNQPYFKEATDLDIRNELLDNSEESVLPIGFQDIYDTEMEDKGYLPDFF